MRIAEIYASIQGEGRLTGAPSVFVRASGCNLRCGYCDTPYASWRPEGEDLSHHDILREIERLGRTHVVLTGGEPMLFSELIPLCSDLRRRGLHITIETAGTLYLPLDCDLMSISPKLASSTPQVGEGAGAATARWRARHDRTRWAPEVVQRLMEEHDYQLKFVIDSLQDAEEAQRYLEQLPGVDRQRVLLMPQGIDPIVLADTQAWLEPYCRERGFVFCPRKQIEWFGSRRGT